MSRKRINTALLTILGLLLAALFLSPFYIIIINAFKTQKDFLTDILALPKYLYPDNFKQAVHDTKYFKTIGNTVFITSGSLVLIIITASMAAWRLTRTFERKISKMIYYMLVAGMLVPFQGIMLPFVKWIDRLGLMNKPGMWFIYMGFGASMAMFLIGSFVSGIPKEIEEAGIIDGCGIWQLFWRVVFALLKPILLSVVFLDLIWIWNDYLMPSLIINQPGNQTLPLMVFQFFGGQFKKWSLALAGLLLVMAPVVVFYMFAQKWVIKGIADGAVKQ